MNILFVHNRYRYAGGEEQVIDNLSELLSSQGHRVRRFERSSQSLLDHPWWQRPADALNTVYSRSVANDLARELRNERTGLVHVHNVFPVLSPAVYRVAHRMGIPIVQTLHNYRFLCANGLFLKPDQEICERCKFGHFWSAVRFGCYGGGRLATLPMAASLAWHRKQRTFEQTIRAFIAPSHFLKTKLVEGGFPENRISVIPNPGARSFELETLSSIPTFVYAGRLSREKGLWTLVRAFEPLTSMTLRILGDGPLLAELKGYVESRRLAHIELPGKVQKSMVDGDLAKAWSLIMPSECYENLPSAVIEAWSHGTPVIASHLGGLAELVREGENGFSFQAGDSADLQNAVQRAAKTLPGSDLRQRCRDHYRRTFDSAVVYPQILKVYNAALSTPASGV